MTHPSLCRWGPGNGVYKDPLDESVKPGMRNRVSQTCLDKNRWVTHVTRQTGALPSRI